MGYFKAFVVCVYLAKFGACEAVAAFRAILALLAALAAARRISAALAILADAFAVIGVVIRGRFGISLFIRPVHYVNVGIIVCDGYSARGI